MSIDLSHKNKYSAWVSSVERDKTKLQSQPVLEDKNLTVLTVSNERLESEQGRQQEREKTQKNVFALLCDLKARWVINLAKWEVSYAFFWKHWTTTYDTSYGMWLCTQAASSYFHAIFSE